MSNESDALEHFIRFQSKAVAKRLHWAPRLGLVEQKLPYPREHQEHRTRHPRTLRDRCWSQTQILVSVNLQLRLQRVPQRQLEAWRIHFLQSWGFQFDLAKLLCLWEEGIKEKEERRAKRRTQVRYWAIRSLRLSWWRVFHLRITLVQSKPWKVDNFHGNLHQFRY